MVTAEGILHRVARPILSLILLYFFCVGDVAWRQGASPPEFQP